MNGFVKLRRGLAEHVRNGRMTLSEHGAFTLLLQLADFSNGRWYGTQRSFAIAAGISSGSAWKLLTSLERKGYLLWDRNRGCVEILRFSVDNPPNKPVQNPVQMSASHRRHDQPDDRFDHPGDQDKRNVRRSFKKQSMADAVPGNSLFDSAFSEKRSGEEAFLRCPIPFPVRQLARRKALFLAVHPVVPSHTQGTPDAHRAITDRSPP